MDSLLPLALAAQVAAAVAAVVLSRRRPSYGPVAITLSILALATVSKFPILAALRPLPRPVEGSGRVLIYLDSALTLAVAAVVPGLALALAGARRGVAAVVGVWAVASVAMGVLYPSNLVRGPNLAKLYLFADLAGLFVAVVGIATWMRRRLSPGLEHFVLFLLVASDIAILLVPYSPWRDGLFTAQYDGTRLIVLLLFAAITMIQVVTWRYTSTVR